MLLLFGAVVTSFALLGVLFPGSGLTTASLVWIPGVLLSVALCQRFDPNREIGLSEVFTLALSLRWVVAAGIHIGVYQTRPGLFAPDETTYERLAVLVALYLEGRIPDLPPPHTDYLGSVWIAGACYWVFGDGPLVPKFLNGLAGAWTAVMTALIARRATNPESARRAGFLAAVFPSLVLWSTLQLKDIWALFGGLLALLGFLHIREKLRLRAAVLIAAGLGLMSTVRLYQVSFVVVAAAASLLFSGRRGQFGRSLVVFVAMAVVSQFAFQSAREATGMLDDTETLERMNEIRGGYATDEAASSIDTRIVDTSTVAGFLFWAPVGLAYFFLGPFPFTGTSMISLATSPEMVWLYTLVPSVVRGGRALLRGQALRTMLAPLLYLVIAAVSWSATAINVGTLYRYRAQVLFFPLILAAHDQVRRRRAAAWSAPVAGRQFARAIGPPAAVNRAGQPCYKPERR